MKKLLLSLSLLATLLVLIHFAILYGPKQGKLISTINTTEEQIQYSIKSALLLENNKLDNKYILEYQLQSLLIDRYSAIEELQLRPKVYSFHISSSTYDFLNTEWIIHQFLSNELSKIYPAETNRLLTQQKKALNKLLKETNYLYFPCNEFNSIANDGGCNIELHNSAEGKKLIDIITPQVFIEVQYLDELVLLDSGIWGKFSVNDVEGYLNINKYWNHLARYNNNIFSQIF